LATPQEEGSDPGFCTSGKSWFNRDERDERDGKKAINITKQQDLILYFCLSVLSP
jgi:hypothetical protein